MNKLKILSDKQVLFLNLISQEKRIISKFYLSGGTALTEYYISYRLSEDLDFFSFEEVMVDGILAFLKKIKSEIDYKNMEFNTSFNRNLFFLKFHDSQLKLEFTYYPFEQVEKPRTINGIPIDSLIDIAVNKLFTIYQKPRTRDFIDLYMICQQEHFKIEDLIKKAQIKFDTAIDLIKLGSQLMLVNSIKDYPRLLIKINDLDWQNFFLSEAKNIGKKIFK
ncbi:MAG: nucleotidyl transferase AbiEii/AbiGii toxin family protein [Candidatus Berkelbacteria bacterium]|nr:nucleotidyl transferase AbiEii/AbiGii toxin family protein [Candidatus Berkelbacteria bacterium]